MDKLYQELQGEERKKIQGEERKKIQGEERKKIQELEERKKVQELEQRKERQRKVIRANLWLGSWGVLRGSSVFSSTTYS